MRELIASKSESAGVWLRIQAFLALKSENTQRTYATIIKEWCQFLKVSPQEKGSADAILAATDLHASAYVAWLRRQVGQRSRFESTISPSHKGEISTLHSKLRSNDGSQNTQSNATIAKKVACLRRIYKSLISAGLGISRNPFDSDSLPLPSSRAGQKRPTQMLDFKVVNSVLDLAKADQPKGLRDKVVLSLLFAGGLRRSEVVKIRIGDVSRTSHGTTFVTLRATKSKKDANQALPSWAGDLLHQLKHQRLEEGAKSGDFLIVSYRGKGGLIPTNQPFSDNGLYRLFKMYCKKAGLSDFLTPHSARATAITKLLDSGVDHRKVQEFSRHSSVQMVEVYDKRRISIDDNPAKILDYD